MICVGADLHRKNVRIAAAVEHGKVPMLPSVPPYPVPPPSMIRIKLDIMPCNFEGVYVRGTQPLLADH